MMAIMEGTKRHLRPAAPQGLAMMVEGMMVLAAEVVEVLVVPVAVLMVVLN